MYRKEYWLYKHMQVRTDDTSRISCNLPIFIPDTVKLLNLIQFCIQTKHLALLVHKMGYYTSMTKQHQFNIQCLKFHDVFLECVPLTIQVTLCVRA